MLTHLVLMHAHRDRGVVVSVKVTVVDVTVEGVTAISTPPPHAQHASVALIRTPLCVVEYSSMDPHCGTQFLPLVPLVVHHSDCA